MIEVDDYKRVRVSDVQKKKNHLQKISLEEKTDVSLLSRKCKT